MNRFLICCLLLTVLCSQSIATDYRCDANGGVCYQTRVVDLPQDQNKFYCTIIGSQSDPQVQELATWFNTNPDLAHLKQGTHFAVMASDSVMYQKRYSATTTTLPCVRVQDSQGNVIF